MTADVDPVPVDMLCTDKGSIVGAQYWSEWTDCGMAHFKVRILCSEMTEPPLRVYHHLQVFIIDWCLMFVNQTQMEGTAP